MDWTRWTENCVVFALLSCSPQWCYVDTHSLLFLPHVCFHDVPLTTFEKLVLYLIVLSCCLLRSRITIDLVYAIRVDV